MDAYGSRPLRKKQRKTLGRYIVADPEICHGKPTFIGTRIMVWQVLSQVADGMSWDKITAEWRGSVTKEAIAEAVELAQRGEYLEARAKRASRKKFEAALKTVPDVEPQKFDRLPNRRQRRATSPHRRGRKAKS
jgi:uncharacterized protein (DUF433 family)